VHAMQQRRRRRKPLKPRPDPAQLERIGLVLDYMPFGNRRDPHKHHQKEPVVQAIGFRYFTLLDGIPLNFSDVDFFEKVSLLSEMLKTIIRLRESRKGLRTNVILACYRGAQETLCLPLTSLDEMDRKLLEASFEEYERVKVLSDLSEMEEFLKSKGMPLKMIRVPPTPIRYDDLSPTARDNLRGAIERIVREREKEFVQFFNIAEPINVRLHAIELLPGIGKKTLRRVLQYRARKPFESFDEIHSVIKVDPVSSLVEKILEEIRGEASYYLFVRPQPEEGAEVERGRPFLDYISRISRARSYG
jgi:putative nucleotide binding protein